MHLRIPYQSSSEQNAPYWFDGSICFGFEDQRYRPYIWLAKKVKKRYGIRTKNYLTFTDRPLEKRSRII
ncbi:MAG TPA: hypothetical protein DEP47_00255 [Chloroflexi bacterium]|nr:hypothetical protein [Chloroflexota bacterium]